jgi:hypothetical protein
MPKGLQGEKCPAVVVGSTGSVARAAPSALKEKQASPATNALIERSLLRSQDQSALTQRAVERLMATKTGATPDVIMTCCRSRKFNPGGFAR